MMKKTSTKKGLPPKPKPELKWQTGEYDRCAEFRFVLPYQFLLLCRLMDITPEQVLRDFMDNLSCGSWNREGRDNAKEQLINYFIAHGYGRHHYSKEDIRKIFIEMDALGMLLPTNANNDLVELYTNWRHKHHTHWFNQWFAMPRRGLSKISEPQNGSSSIACAKVQNHWDAIQAGGDFNEIRNHQNNNHFCHCSEAGPGFIDADQILEDLRELKMLSAEGRI